MMLSIIDKFLQTDFSSDYVQLQNEYLSANISYFDHWLSEEEYQSANLICYADIENDIQKLELFEKIQSQFVSFYKLLFQLAQKNVYVSFERYWVISREAPSKIKSYDDYVTYVIEALREKQLCSLFFPELNCLIFTGYDLTHEFYLRKDSSHSELVIWNEINNSANACGLCIIE